MAATGTSARGQVPVAAFSDSEFDFGKVPRGTSIEHDFVVRNAGSGLLRFSRVVVTPPFELIHPPEEIGPHGEAALPVRLLTGNLMGSLQGEILINLNDPTFPQHRIRVRGEVYPLVQLANASDLAAANGTMSAFRGEVKRASLEIV